jgi:hypothetical protein
MFSLLNPSQISYLFTGFLYFDLCFLLILILMLIKVKELRFINKLFFLCLGLFIFYQGVINTLRIEYVLEGRITPDDFTVFNYLFSPGLTYIFCVYFLHHIFSSCPVTDIGIDKFTIIPKTHGLPILTTVLVVRFLLPWFSYTDYAIAFGILLFLASSSWRVYKLLRYNHLVTYNYFSCILLGVIFGYFFK